MSTNLSIINATIEKIIIILMESSILESEIDRIKKAISDHGYKYIEPLGKGGFSSVHLVSSEKYSCEFAIKISQRRSSIHASCVDTEISSLLKLTHPNVIQMYEFFYDDLFIYVVLEYCPGGSLEDYIKKNGPLKKKELALTCQQIIEALQHCHEQNIAHRDLKPANILLDRHNRCKLADFGISDLQSSTKVRLFNGTYSFMAPEVVLKEAHDARKSDIWSLAVTFYMLATGELPWGNCKDKAELKKCITLGAVSLNGHDFDFSFVLLLKRMFKLNPEERPDISELLQYKIFTDFCPNECLSAGSSLMKLPAHAYTCYKFYNSRRRSLRSLSVSPFNNPLNSDDDNSSESLVEPPKVQGSNSTRPNSIGLNSIQSGFKLGLYSGQNLASRGKILPKQVPLSMNPHRPPTILVKPKLLKGGF
ncbi:CAMK family protein kinase [Tritrichomonas foetus]|uniref:CAMK family protein kinase n=1 Tax=Tritrichomonas foetus TaxID=1144522 RepID=A0A1J4JMC8_9EUKA|nr:CAMK family protein kinase [Tritrichomonas foetus]|eukprot:OHS99583.1 CAMK family protein kinase [Tritrichomonas foetus]